MKVFVTCDVDKLDRTLATLEQQGFIFERRSRTLRGVLIGAVEPSKLPALRSIAGVLKVHENIQLDQISSGVEQKS